MEKRVTFTILIIVTLFLVLLTFFGNSGALSGFAVKNTQLISDNFLFGIFILLFGIIVAMGYLLKSKKPL